METFVQTNDGKYAYLRHRGMAHYGVSPEDLARQLGIDEFEIVIDPQQPKRPALPQVARGVTGFSYF